MTALNKQAGEGDVRPKTYYIHPAAFGCTKDPGHRHVPVVKADDFEKLRAKLESAEKRIEDEICRANREHHRGFMMACNHLKEHANVHYADAAEMEIAALRQRINELEARTVMLPQYRNSPDMHTKQFYEAIGFNQGLDIFIEALRAAGIGVKGE